MPLSPMSQCGSLRIIYYSRVLETYALNNHFIFHSVAFIVIIIILSPEALQKALYPDPFLYPTGN